MNNWGGILKIIEIEHVRDSKVIWSQKDLRNLLHDKGEELLLHCCFNNDGSYPPSNYFFGLDNRATISKQNDIYSILEEPTGGGYSRRSVPSNGEFSIEESNGGYRATSSIMTFSATGGGWGPVKNMFMSTSSDDSGILVSSVALSQEVTLISGDAINLRMSLSLS